MTAPTSRMDGIPPGSIEAVVDALRRARGPLRRRALLEELDHRGHRISLAGLNRVLEYCRLERLTSEGHEGIRLTELGRARR